MLQQKVDTNESAENHWRCDHVVDIFAVAHSNESFPLQYCTRAVIPVLLFGKILESAWWRPSIHYSLTDVTVMSCQVVSIVSWLCNVFVSALETGEYYRICLSLWCSAFSARNHLDPQISEPVSSWWPWCSRFWCFYIALYSHVPDFFSAHNNMLRPSKHVIGFTGSLIIRLVRHCPCDPVWRLCKFWHVILNPFARLICSRVPLNAGI